MSKKKNTSEWRAKLAEIDCQIVALLDRRFALARELQADPARAAALPGATPEHLAVALRQLEDVPAEALPKETLKAVFREVWSGTAALAQPPRIAFFGQRMTYTHQAAMASFGHGAEYIEQPTIRDVFDAVSRGEATCGVVPVENSTEGAVTHTLDMFADSEVSICSELNLPIHHCLLANCAEDRIEVLYSHPQVFGQCRRWLYRTMPEAHLVEVTSTTEAAARAAASVVLVTSTKCASGMVR